MGGSAFDAFVEYDLPGGGAGFIGIETKYHEDLAKGLKIPKDGSLVRDKYVKETGIRPWSEGAADQLLAHRRNLQFWYNQLLCQRTFELAKTPSGARRYTEYTMVVVASSADMSAKAVVKTVADQLAEGHQDRLRFCAIDDVLGRVMGHEGWQQELRRRYTDFTPIQEHLSPRSPLRVG